MRSSNSSAPRVRTGCWSRGVRRRTLSWWASDSKWKLFRLWMELKEMKTSHSWRWLQAARSNSDLSLCIFYEGVFSIFSKRVCFFLEIINNLILDGKFYIIGKVPLSSRDSVVQSEIFAIFLEKWLISNVCHVSFLFHELTTFNCVFLLPFSRVQHSSTPLWGFRIWESSRHLITMSMFSFIK